MDRERELQKLSAFPSGSRVRVGEVCADACARCRAFALGLTPGAEVEVVANGQGSCRLKVRGSDLVLGHGAADAILVSPKG
jgi:ferrous iron transport protein A